MRPKVSVGGRLGRLGTARLTFEEPGMSVEAFASVELYEAVLFFPCLGLVKVRLGTGSTLDDGVELKTVVYDGKRKEVKDLVYYRENDEKYGYVSYLFDALEVHLPSPFPDRLYYP
ncbi:MAG: hypothetical protein GXO43_03840 [Crenarchaeota archaeon]|nr:hypothetical protein [Thermoproteota archaeon]